MFITRVRKGKGAYWVLKAAVWDREAKRNRQVYLGYIGTSARISEAKARELAAKASKKLGREITVEDLRRVKRLRIVPDPSGEQGAKEQERERDEPPPHSLRQRLIEAGILLPPREESSASASTPAPKVRRGGIYFTLRRRAGAESAAERQVAPAAGSRLGEPCPERSGASTGRSIMERSRRAALVSKGE